MASGRRLRSHSIEPFAHTSVNSVPSSSVQCPVTMPSLVPPRNGRHKERMMRFNTAGSTSVPSFRVVGISVVNFMSASPPGCAYASMCAYKVQVFQRCALWRTSDECAANRLHAAAIGAQVRIAEPRRRTKVNLLLLRIDQKLHVIDKSHQSRRELDVQIRLGCADDLHARLKQDH